MSDDPHNLAAVVRSLARRIEHLERELDALKQSQLPTSNKADKLPPEALREQAATTPELAQPASPEIAPPAVPPVAIETFEIEEPTEVVVAPTAPPTVPGKRDVLRGLSSPAAASSPSAPTIAPPVAPSTSPRREPARKPTLEMLVGGRGLAAVGALILVVGFGLFLKYAYDEGWLRVSPVLRCLAGAGFGLGLVGLGEWLRKKYGALAASGATAAGLGVLYTTVFAAYRLFGLLEAPAAFALLGATAVFGVAIGARSKLIIVAALSLIAGYVTPYLFAGTHATVWALPAYLLMLLSIGLGLSAWRGAAFAALRTLVWWGTIGLGGFWALQVSSSSFPTPGAACIFLAIAWLAIHGELCFSALRGVLTLAGPSSFVDAPAGRTMARWRPLVSSFSTTAWAVGLIVQSGYFNQQWLVPAAAASVTLMLSFFLGGVMTPALKPPATDRERLSASLLIQAAGLLVLTTAMALSGLGQVLSWIVLGVCAVLAGRWMKARPFNVYGLVVLTLATGRLVVIDSWATGLTASPIQFGGLMLSQWTLGMELCAAAWIGLGLLVREDGRHVAWRRVGECAVGVGLIVVGAGLVHAEISAVLLAVIAAGVLVALSGAALPLRSIILLAMSLAPVIVGSLATLSSRWWEWKPSSGRGLPISVNTLAPFVMGAGVLVARVLSINVIAARNGTSEPRLWMTPHAVVATLLLVAGCYHTGAPETALMFAWTLIAAGWLVNAKLNTSGYGAYLGLGVLAQSVLAWIGLCLFKNSPMRESALLPAAPLIIGLGLCSVCIKRGWGCGGNPRPQARAACQIGALSLFFVASSFEVARIASDVAANPMARGSAISIYWGLFAVALLAAGFARRVAWLRYAGLGLMGVAAVKAVVFDLGNVPPVWRIASFIGLGVLMLATHFAYSRLSASLLGERPEEPDETPPGRDA